MHRKGFHIDETEIVGLLLVELLPYNLSNSLEFDCLPMNLTFREIEMGLIFVKLLEIRMGRCDGIALCFLGGWVCPLLYPTFLWKLAVYDPNPPRLSGPVNNEVQMVILGGVFDDMIADGCVNIDRDHPPSGPADKPTHGIPQRRNWN